MTRRESNEENHSERAAARIGVDFALTLDPVGASGAEMIDNRYEYGQRVYTFAGYRVYVGKMFIDICGLRMRDIPIFSVKLRQLCQQAYVARRGHGRYEARELLDYNTRGIDWTYNGDRYLMLIITADLPLIVVNVSYERINFRTAMNR